ncbi:MAG: hypothetical protein GOU98_04405 [Candidatus Altiarchaeota archaeon]|nr:hypothetical protein [Candidatus Altiarchaeota archaeon]
MNMKWLAIVFVLTLVFAENIIDTELGYVDVDGVVAEGEHFTLDGNTLKITAASTTDFTALSYSVSITPRNLERIAVDMGIPLSGDLNVSILTGQVHTQTIELPDIVCGTYKVSGDLEYVTSGVTQTLTDNLKLSIPCKNFKSSFVSGMVARLPYPILKFFAGLLGVRFG